MYVTEDIFEFYLYFLVDTLSLILYLDCIYFGTAFKSQLALKSYLAMYFNLSFHFGLHLSQACEKLVPDFFQNFTDKSITHLFIHLSLFFNSYTVSFLKEKKWLWLFSVDDRCRCQSISDYSGFCLCKTTLFMQKI